MDSMLAFGLETTRWLQDNYPQLAGFFVFISTLGNEEFYLAAMPLLYWCVSKKAGRILGYIFFIALLVNTILKHALRGPRPFWLDETVGIVETGGYGIPSGHVQYATIIYLFLAAWINRGWAWILAFLMIILMALSRVYVGAHFVHDVIAGFIAGLIILIIYYFWNRYQAQNFSKRILGQKLMVVFLIPVIFGLVYIGVLFLIGAPDMSLPWATFIPEAEIASVTEMATAFGAALGFGIGIILEGSRVRFHSDGPISKRIGRYILGIIGAVIIWQGLGLVFPRDPLWLAIPLRIFRYFLLTFWAAYYAPLIFVRLNLADADPDPGINLKM